MCLCNLLVNVIIPLSFSMQYLEETRIDNRFLKSCLWPQLHKVPMNAPIAKSRDHLLHTISKCEGTNITHHEQNCLAGVLVDLQGEGTYEHHGSTSKLSRHLAIRHNSNFSFGNV